MRRAQIVAAGGAAALLFWVVGAYNRLVRLRAVIVRRFGTVAEQLRQRQAVLAEWMTLLENTAGAPVGGMDALRAASGQVDAACTHAQQRPGTIGAITSLRMAEHILAGARERLVLPEDLVLGDVGTRLSASDATLAFASAQFNAAVDEYNSAVQQFPTILLSRLFGFRVAGTL